MTVYLLHFDRPFGHATHYLGFAEPHRLIDRLSHHRQGTGANLCRHVAAAGIGWQLARLWEDGSRTRERQIKNQGGKAGVCPLCDRKGLQVPAQRFAVSGFVPVLSMAGSVVHAAHPDRPRTLCRRDLEDSWRVLPSDDAAVEVAGIRRSGCRRCVARLDRHLVTVAQRVEEAKVHMVQVIQDSLAGRPDLIGRPISEL